MCIFLTYSQRFILPIIVLSLSIFLTTFNMINLSIDTDAVQNSKVQMLMENAWVLVDFGQDDAIANGMLEPIEIDTTACMKDNFIHFLPNHATRIHHGLVLCKHNDFYYEQYDQKWFMLDNVLYPGNGKHYEVHFIANNFLLLINKQEAIESIYIFENA